MIYGVTSLSAILKEKGTGDMNELSKTYRNVIVRLTKVNVLKSDNLKLGLHAGEVYEYTKDSVLEILNNWTETKQIEYFMIEHNVGEENNDHYHLVIRFGKNVCSFKTLKNRFPYGSIEKCRYGVRACVQYLVHMNNPDKKQYSWDEVVTNAPAKLEEYKQPSKAAMNDKLKTIIDQILSGELKRFEISKIDPEIYIRYKRKIEAAFDYRMHMLMESSTRNIDVIVLQGKPGFGKSSFCKMWADKNGKSIIYSSCSNDIFQDYQGQDIFCMDDPKYDKISIQDMLKIIDPHVMSSAKSRYNNKLFVGDTIFICTNTDILKWYYKEDEDLREAFYRRIKYVMTFDAISRDMITYITVNEIQNIQGHRDLIPIKEMKVDLKPYIEKNSASKDDFLDTLDDLSI